MTNEIKPLTDRNRYLIGILTELRARIQDMDGRLASKTEELIKRQEINKQMISRL